MLPLLLPMSGKVNVEAVLPLPPTLADLPCIDTEVAGRMAVQQGAKYLERPMGGRGKLLAGVPGVAPGRVLIIGGGVVGKNAAFVASGMGQCVHSSICHCRGSPAHAASNAGADVTVLDSNVDRLRYLNDIFKNSVHTVFSTPYSIQKCLTEADIIIGAV